MYVGAVRVGNGGQVCVWGGGTVVCGLIILFIYLFLKIADGTAH